MKAEQGFNYKLLQALASLLGLSLLLVWMQGGFSSKVPPGTVQAAEARPAAQGPTATAQAQEIEEILSWPGMVSARSVASIASKVSARILEITVNSGDAVKKGQVLARLDERELQSHLAQARSSLAAMEAEAARAEAERRRMQNLFEREAATRQSLETAQAAARSASARTQEARAGITAAESVLTETVLRAPFDGAIIKRELEPGAMAMPGVPVLLLQSNQRLRVEAAIPERCAPYFSLGAAVQAHIGGQAYPAKIEEIAPAADPGSHTVLVKAGLDNPGPAQPGAFATLAQACGKRSALLIPAQAVTRSGQLQSVQLQGHGLRHVRTGKAHGGQVEILSGLSAGDVVVLGGHP
jgi:RND family efflux transporter MFP subunit